MYAVRHRKLVIMSSNSIFEVWVHLNMTNVDFALMIVYFFDLIFVIDDSASVDADVILW